MKNENSVEIRGFLHLATVFEKRGWPFPYRLDISESINGTDLLSKLEVPENEVEALFINGKAYLVEDALISPGDRVALVPPGTPGPYRVFLGFVKLDSKN